MNTTTNALNVNAVALQSSTILQNGAFAIKSVLGQGGFGITYLGGDLKLRRYVAIKEFFPNEALRQGNQVVCNSLAPAQFEEAKKKFVNEARALARFRHSNIAQVLSIFKENNTAYIVMEYLDGLTFQQMITERGVLPEKQAIEYIKQIGAALEAVHKVGLVHRDVKPDNVIVCKDGRAVLIDFGINKKLEQSVGQGTRQISHTTAFGTDGYAPPEQHLRNAPHGAFTDVYALGATLYFLLTGQTPTSAPERSMGAALLTPDAVNPNTSHVASLAVMRALELKSAERPQSVQEFFELLSGRTGQATAQSAFVAAPTTVLNSATTNIAPTAILSNQSSTRFSPTQAPTTTSANDSGLGASSVLPDELRGWNWGAFLWTFIWGIAHRCWWSLLCLIPYVNIVVGIMMGVKGNELAWKNRKWESVEQFKNTQRKWGYAAIVAIALVTLLVIPVLTILGKRVETVFNVADNTLVTEGTGSDNTTPLAQSETTAFVSNYGYQITPPAEWKVDSSGKGEAEDTDVTLTSSDEADRAHMSVIVADAEVGETLENDKAQIPIIYAQSFPNYRLVKKGDILIDGVPAFFNTITCQSPGSAESAQVHQVYTLKDGKAYVVTSTASSSSFSNYESTFNAVISSMRWSR